MELNVNFINNFFITQHNLTINTLSQTLMEKNEEIYKLGKWRDEGWKQKEKRIRNIVDVHEELKYLRRIYRRWNYEDNCWEYKSFLDEELGIKKYQKLTLDLELKILELSEGKRQKDIIDCFPWLNLSKMTISRTIRKYDIEYFSGHLFNEFEKIKLEKNSCLYIFMAEGFVLLKEDKQIKDFRCRITTFNTGFNFKECKYNRKVLANKIGFVILKE